MKSIDEIINQEPVFLNDWNERFDVIADFENVYMSKDDYVSTVPTFPNITMWHEEKEKMKNGLKKHKYDNILFASYGCDNYEGDAWVLFERYGKLYEINGGHCSCYGLEGQWDSEEVSLEELKHRLQKGTFGENDWSDNNFKEELCRFLGVEFVQNKERYIRF